jgi:type I restriction enzyme S subunit
MSKKGEKSLTLRCGGQEKHQRKALREGWDFLTLGDVCVFENGDRGENYPSKSFQTTSGIPFINAGHLSDSGLDFSKMSFIPRERFNMLGNGKIKRGDILFCLRGSLGKFACVGELGEGAIASSLIIIRPKENVLGKYLEAYFSSDLCTKMIEFFRNGAAQPNLSGNSLKQFTIPLPPLPEQRRIVAILDEAFAGIAIAKANAEKNLQNARAIFESHLQAVVAKRGEGWVVRKISEIAIHSLGKMLDKAKNKGKLQPYLRNINVRWFGFDLSDLLQMPFLPSESAKFTAIKGDVLICEGGYPGRAAIWTENYPIYFQKALHRVRFHEPEHNKWLLYYLFVQDKSGELKHNFSGTGIQHFTGEVLARFELPMPPLTELRRAVAKLDALCAETRSLAVIYERKLSALDELKKSLLDQAFSGRL